MRKAILAIMMALSFLTLVAVPAMSQPITIIKPEDNKTLKETTTTIDVDTTKIKTFMIQIEEFQTWLQENRPFKDFVLTEQEKTEIKSRVNGLITTLNEFLVENSKDPITTDWLWNEMFETELGRSTIASIGRGMCFIPFYDYETFLGVMLRPMWLVYRPLFFGRGGYTGNFNVNFLPPRIEYGDRLGAHIVRTLMFTGLYINIGELGFDLWTSGPIVLLGRARVVMH